MSQKVSSNKDGYVICKFVYVLKGHLSDVRSWICITKQPLIINGISVLVWINGNRFSSVLFRHCDSNWKFTIANEISKTGPEIKLVFLVLVSKTLRHLHRDLTSLPSNTSWMNWNTYTKSVGQSQDFFFFLLYQCLWWLNGSRSP